MRISEEELASFCDEKLNAKYPNMTLFRLAQDLRDLKYLSRSLIEAIITHIAVGGYKDLLDAMADMGEFLGDA